MNRLRFNCPHCRHALSAAADLAGQDLPCPTCRRPVQVPRHVEQAAALPAAKKSATALGSQEGPWHLRKRTGEQYGPVPKATLDAWVREGRVAGGGEVWAQGWPDWKPIAAVYPELAAGAGAPPATMPPLPPRDAPGSRGEGLDWNTVIGSGRGNGGQSAQPAGFSDAIPRQVLGPLLDCGLWMKLVATYCFTSSALVLLATFNLLSTLDRAGSQVPSGVATGMVIGFVLALILMMTVGFVILQCNSSVAALARSNTRAALTRALGAQRSFWRLVGIIALLGLGLQALFFLLGIAAVLSR